MNQIEIRKYTTTEWVVAANKGGAAEILAQCSREDIAKKIQQALCGEPEPTEFTRKARVFIPPQRIFENEEKDIEQLELLLHEACDLIDRLTAEKQA